MNGELRDREKVMRSLKREDSPILKGMLIFHNFVRPHMSLEGKTPSEVAGIKIEGENKSLTLIFQNASHVRQSTHRKATRVSLNLNETDSRVIFKSKAP